MNVLQAIRLVIGIGRLGYELADEIMREKAKAKALKNARLAPKRKQMSDIYAEASRNAGNEPTK